MADFATIYATALAADEAFEKACRDAGYSSRWAWIKGADDRPYDAYCAKLAADEAVHRWFEFPQAQ